MGDSTQTRPERFFVGVADFELVARDARRGRDRGLEFCCGRRRLGTETSLEFTDEH